MESLKFDLPKKYLSASAISTLLRCPKQFEFRYIHDVLSKPNAAAITGKAAHGAFEHYYQDAIDTKTVRMTSKKVAELSVDVLKEELEKAEFKLPATEYDLVVEDLQDLTTSYVENVAEGIKPFSVETQFTYVTQCGVELYGFLDLLEELGEGTDPDVGADLGIVDYKVTKTKWNKAKLTNSLQFNLYSMAMGIPQVTIHNLVKGPKTKKLPTKPPVEGVVDVTNKIRVLTNTFDSAGFQHFENLVYTAARVITSGIFMPCDPESWCCTPDWCGYWEFCRGAGLGKPKIIVDLDAA